MNQRLRIFTWLLLILGLNGCMSNKKVAALTANYQAEIGQLNEQLRNAHDELSRLQIKIAESKGANDALLLSQDKYLKRIDQLEDEIDVAQNKAVNQQSSLGDAISQREKKINGLEQQLASVRDALKQHDTDNDKLAQMLRDSFINLSPAQYNIAIEDGQVVVAFTESLLFRNGAANKLEPLGLVSLAVLARVLNANPRAFIQVVGHVDNLPASRKNQDSWDFTALRAAVVVRHLVNNLEILPNRVLAGGKGEFDPATSNETSEGQSRNRRVEFNIFFQSEQVIKQIKQLTDRK